MKVKAVFQSERRSGSVFTVNILGERLICYLGSMLSLSDPVNLVNHWISLQIGLKTLQAALNGLILSELGFVLGCGNLMWGMDGKIDVLGQGYGLDLLSWLVFCQRYIRVYSGFRWHFLLKLCEREWVRCSAILVRSVCYTITLAQMLVYSPW